jgi:hypothetical protein
MDWLNRKNEFSDQDLKLLQFCPDYLSTCAIESIRLSKGENVSVPIHMWRFLSKFLFVATDCRSRGVQCSSPSLTKPRTNCGSGWKGLVLSLRLYDPLGAVMAHTVPPGISTGRPTRAPWVDHNLDHIPQAGGDIRGGQLAYAGHVHSLRKGNMAQSRQAHVPAQITLASDTRDLYRYCSEQVCDLAGRLVMGQIHRYASYTVSKTLRLAMC